MDITLYTIAPHGGDDVRLGELYHDATRAELVTCVARLPVIVPGVAIEQGIPTSAHSLQHRGTGRDASNIFRRNYMCKRNEKHDHTS